MSRQKISTSGDLVIQSLIELMELKKISHMVLLKLIEDKLGEEIPETSFRSWLRKGSGPRLIKYQRVIKELLLENGLEDPYAKIDLEKRKNKGQIDRTVKALQDYMDRNRIQSYVQLIDILEDFGSGKLPRNTVSTWFQNGSGPKLKRYKDAIEKMLSKERPNSLEDKNVTLVSDNLSGIKPIQIERIYQNPKVDSGETYRTSKLVSDYVYLVLPHLGRIVKEPDPEARKSFANCLGIDKFHLLYELIIALRHEKNRDEVLKRNPDFFNSL